MSTSNLRAARLSVLIIFFIHGAVFSTWVSRLPAVQAALGLSTGALGFSLLGIAAGSLVSMPLSGWLISRYGSKLVTAVSSLCFCLALILPALANTALTLGVALSILGLGAGAMDVAMNAQGVAVERLVRKPVMSGFHAGFSIGGMAGSGLGGVIAKAGVNVFPHFASAAVLYFVAVALVIRSLVNTDAGGASSGARFRLTPTLLGLGAICFCFFLSEGSMADWSALYLTRLLHAGPAQAAAGYAVFSAAMAVGRTVGDRLRARFGDVSLVRNGALVAAAGLALALLFSSTALALAGFGMVGLGCSIIVPITFAAAAKQTHAAGGALAVVVTMGYFGLFVGPPLIGISAEALTLRWAMFLVVGLCLIGAGLAHLVRTVE